MTNSKNANTIKRDLQRLADEIARCRRMAEFHRDGNDESLAETYDEDATALQTIHDAVVAGDFQYAEYLAHQVDTAVRDRVPVRLYNTICDISEKLAEKAEGEKTMTKKTTKKASKKAAKKTSKKAAKKTSKAKADTDTKMSCLDAAAKVLAESRDALNTTEMFDAMVKKGYWKSDAPTPQNTIYSAILREIKVKGKDSRFCKVERGRFGLSK